MSKTVEIGYVSSTDRDYSEALKKVKTLAELLELVEYYQPLTKDALAKVKSMDNADFDNFKKDMKFVRTATGKKAEHIVEQWGAIILPETMVKVSMVAMHFGAPFGTAFIRMKEEGQI